MVCQNCVWLQKRNTYYLNNNDKSYHNDSLYYLRFYIIILIFTSTELIITFILSKEYNVMKTWENYNKIFTQKLASFWFEGKRQFLLFYY